LQRRKAGDGAMTPMKGVIICPDGLLREEMEEAFRTLGVLVVARSVGHYPEPDELLRILRASAPQILFLSVENLDKATAVFRSAEAQLQGIQTIAMGNAADPVTLMAIMHSGIREMVTSPFEKGPLLDALSRSKEILDRRPVQLESTDRVFSFLPAKPGVGATTLAANSALELSRMKGRRSLLLDCDLTGGMIRFLFQLDGSGCLPDATEAAGRLDERLWDSVVNPVGNLDVVHSGHVNPERLVDPSNLRTVLDFARRNYDNIVLDLSGNMERFSIEILQESKQIFLVVTPELPALHLAREKVQFLRSIHLEERTVALLNRSHRKTGMTAAHIKDLLRCPVLMTFPNDYAAVQRTMSTRADLDQKTDLARQLVELARYVNGDSRTPSEEAPRGLLSFLR
jgi:pilus assembly protein CpaE